MGIAQWLEHWTHDWKVQVSSPGRSGRIMFFSRVNFLFWLLVLVLFQYSFQFHPCVTAVALGLAHKRSQSFCQKCRWQFTCHFIQSHIGMVFVCLAVTCHLQFYVAPAMQKPKSVISITVSVVHHFRVWILLLITHIIKKRLQSTHSESHVTLTAQNCTI